MDKSPIVILIGFITAAIVHQQGAGGPILVVPLLPILGVYIRVAVGVGLLNSIVIFIIPSIFGYFAYTGIGIS